jgi:hypothetical protein
MVSPLQESTRDVSTIPIWSNHAERDFPPSVAGLDELLGAARFGQRQNCVHHGFQLSGVN